HDQRDGHGSGRPRVAGAARRCRRRADEGNRLMLDLAPTEDSKTLVITRTLNAPRALVWKMFADPYHLAQWWGPKGYSNRVEELDFRTGGRWRHVMIAPDGKELPTDNDIVEVTEPERLVFRNAPADPKIFGDN